MPPEATPTQPLIVALAVVLVGALLALWSVYRRLTAERRASHELRRLHAFGQELLKGNLDLEPMCALIATYCQQVAPAPGFAIQLAQSNGQPFCPYATARGQRIELTETGPLTEIYHALERTQQPLLLDNACSPDAPCAPLPIAGIEASALLVPIRTKDQVLGIIALQSDRTGAFTRAQLQGVVDIASQAALGLQAATLLREQRERAAQLLLIAEIGRKVAAILDLPTLFHDTARLVQETFGYYHVSIYRLSDDGQNAILAASSNPEIEQRGLTVPCGMGLVGHAIREGRIHLVNDVLQSELFMHEASLDRTRSELAIPLRAESRILGVLDLQSDAVDAFTEQNASVLQILADQIAVAIEDSHLYALQRQQTRVSEALLQVANVVGGATTSLDDSIATVVQLTPRLVEVSWCMALIWADSNDMPMLHAEGLSQEHITALTQELRQRTKDEVTLRWGGQRHLVEQPDADMIAMCPTLAGGVPFAVVPLTAQEAIVGYLLAGSERVEALQGQGSSLLAGIARQASLAIENAMLYRRMLRQQQFEQEMHLARDIQLSFMPEKLPSLPGWDVAVAWQAARGVGGDFYDFIRLDGNRLGIVIADVSDKGVAAALYMALSRTVMRSTALEGYSSAQTLIRTNSLLMQESRSGMFVTMFYGILDLRTGLLRYARAGHNPPLLARADSGEIEQLYSPGIVLGVVDDPDIEQRTTVMYPGDLLLLYTDGVTESTSPAGQEFGLEGMQAVIRDAPALSAERMIAAIRGAQQAFSATTEATDDFTLLAVRRAAVAQSDTADTKA